MASEGLENLVNSIIEDMEKDNNVQLKKTDAVMQKPLKASLNTDVNIKDTLHHKQVELTTNNEDNLDPVFEDYGIEQDSAPTTKKLSTYNLQLEPKHQSSDQYEANQFLEFTKNISQNIQLEQDKTNQQQKQQDSNDYTGDIIQNLINNNQNNQFCHIADELSHVNKTTYDNLLEQNETFLSNLKDRLLVLFEGFHSPYQKNQEAKIDILINFLEYLLSVVDERLDEIKQIRNS